MLTAAVGLAAALGVALLALTRARSARRLLERRLAKATADLERLQGSFSKFAPAAVVDELAASGASLEATKREVTVLFADLKGFTALSDRLDPAVVVRLLNGYFAEMSAAITAHRGHVSKFIGDGILALFGALEHNPWQTRDAVEAAIAMRGALAKYNERLAEDGFEPLRLSVGLHRGVAVAGVFGCEELMEFTVLGDTVNVASRVEGLTRTHDVDILLTEEVRRELGDRFRLRPLPPVAVKGKPHPIATYAVQEEPK
jgi:class 3 adenylate cyclase